MINFRRQKNVFKETRRQRVNRRLNALEVNVRRMSMELSEIQATMGRNSFQSLLNSLEDVQRQRDARKIEIPLFSEDELGP